ncbi:hypothetical protein ACQP3J_34010, partial [Escherichia coli]
LRQTGTLLLNYSPALHSFERGRHAVLCSPGILPNWNPFISSQMLELQAYTPVHAFIIYFLWLYLSFK